MMDGDHMLEERSCGDHMIVVKIISYNGWVRWWVMGDG